MSPLRRKVILITDGDHVAQSVVEHVARQIGGRCISRSAGNPTPLNGSALVEVIKQAAYDPVLVMFDDRGCPFEGKGEHAIRFLAAHPDIEILGAVAVASNTHFVRGVTVDVSVNADGDVIHHGVDKEGEAEPSDLPRIFGDTVDILENVAIPVIVGIGDIGKMFGRDGMHRGHPVTKKAVEYILHFHGYVPRVSCPTSYKA